MVSIEPSRWNNKKTHTAFKHSVLKFILLSCFFLPLRSSFRKFAKKNDSFFFSCPDCVLAFVYTTFNFALKTNSFCVNDVKARERYVCIHILLAFLFIDWIQCVCEHVCECILFGIDVFIVFLFLGGFRWMFMYVFYSLNSESGWLVQRRLVWLVRSIHLYSYTIYIYIGCI